MVQKYRLAKISKRSCWKIQSDSAFFRVKIDFMLKMFPLHVAVGYGHIILSTIIFLTYFDILSNPTYFNVHVDKTGIHAEKFDSRANEIWLEPKSIMLNIYRFDCQARTMIASRVMAVLLLVYKKRSAINWLSMSFFAAMADSPPPFCSSFSDIIVSGHNAVLLFEFPAWCGWLSSFSAFTVAALSQEFITLSEQRGYMLMLRGRSARAK